MIRTLRTLVRRIAASFADTDEARDFEEELESHLQLHIDDNIHAGMSPQEARRLALIRMGGFGHTIERQADRRRLPFIDTLRQDAQYTIRTVRANPGFALTTVLTLALGMGATTAIFSAVNAVLLQPLPFQDSRRLAMVEAVDSRGDRHDVVSYPTFIDWRDQSHSFSGMAAFGNATATVTVGDDTEFIRGKRVTASMFTVLGVQPALGRAFTEADASQPVAILSDGFWKRHFAASPAALGKTVHILEAPFTVVGVMPAGFHIQSADNEQIYVPLAPDSSRGHGFLRIIGRLRAGVSEQQAKKDLDVITRSLRRQYGARSEMEAASVTPLVDALAGPGRLALLILLAIVTAVLLIACTNVASLLLARGAVRQREMAVRAALGASRGRLIRQLLTEALVLALAGGAAGLVLSEWLARVLVRIVSDSVEVPRLDATHIDGQVLLFAFAVSVITGIVFGIVPAASSASPDLNGTLREASMNVSGQRGPRLRRALVVAETALALVLLSGAGLLMRTLIAMRSTDPGFNTQNMLAVEVWLPPTRFGQLERRAPFFRGVLDRVRTLPGIDDAAFVADLPLNGGIDSEGFHIVGRPDPAPDRWHSSGFNIVSASYFRMMGMRILEGRGFAENDGPNAPGVIVINEAAAQRFWPGRSPIGQQIELPITRERSSLLTVVGVANNVRHGGLLQPARSEIYVCSMQTELTWPAAVLAVRARSNATLLADPIRTAVREVDTAVPVFRINTMDDVIARSMAEPRLYSSLFLAFAAMAVTLAAVGLYGLVAFSVAQRAKELGVRTALGASRREIMTLVLRQGLGLAAAGAAVGLVGGIAASRSLAALIRGVQPGDPITFAVVTIVLLLASLVACYVPARRAANLDPIASLRDE